MYVNDHMTKTRVVLTLRYGTVQGGFLLLPLQPLEVA